MVGDESRLVGGPAAVEVGAAAIVLQVELHVVAEAAERLAQAHAAVGPARPVAAVFLLDVVAVVVGRGVEAAPDVVGVGPQLFPIGVLDDVEAVAVALGLEAFLAAAAADFVEAAVAAEVVEQVVGGGGRGRGRGGDDGGGDW